MHVIHITDILGALIGQRVVELDLAVTDTTNNWGTSEDPSV